MYKLEDNRTSTVVSNIHQRLVLCRIALKALEKRFRCQDVTAPTNVRIIQTKVVTFLENQS